jgi:hypothetical protein
MAESHVVSGLVAKRSELAGLVQHYQSEISRLTGDLHHLDAAIKLFAPEFDLRTLPTRSTGSAANTSSRENVHE